MPATRNLIVVLGDQLDQDSTAFHDFDPQCDRVWMAEVDGESTHVLSHKVRIAIFLSAMRHFAEDLREKKYPVEYWQLDGADNAGTLAGELERVIRRLRPERVVATEPGEYRIEEMLRHVTEQAQVPLVIRPDQHFYCSREEFREWAAAHKQLRLEFFYRDMRRKAGVLMESREPAGARWNFDTENRKSFGKEGPGLLLRQPRSFPPDAITRDVLALVAKRFESHPGSLAQFDLPVTARDAQLALDDFVEHSLPFFGDHQDAMWTDEPFLYHSRLSAAMNLKLINPRTVIMAVEDAYHRGNAPLSGVEGFIRQILGWREYVRGIYWTYMPEYIHRNALDAHEKLPDFYWTGDTDMHCLQQAIGQTLEYGYAHHIQRLMVTGLFSLLFGVDPVEIHKWYLAIYWDAVEWVEMPNTTGMSQFADGGLMGSKPYIASGKYIQRMSNYCQGCRYKPDESTGPDACPFNTLYWDFLMRHEKMLEQNMRTRMQVRNLQRIPAEKKISIREQAAALRASTPKGAY